MIIFESPLGKWPGSFSLPDYDDFTGADWDAWRKAMAATGEDETLNRRYCFGGLTLVGKIGEWKMETLGLAEIQKWQTDKKAERTRLVSWVGKCVAEYIDELIDPKG
jgi:hypothetical protein